MLTLYQYFTTFVCRDLQRAVDGRILKVRVLTDLGLFAEALITLLRLLHGDRLPQIGDSNFRQVESKMPSMHFDNSKPLNELANLKVGVMTKILIFLCNTLLKINNSILKANKSSTQAGLIEQVIICSISKDS